MKRLRWRFLPSIFQDSFPFTTICFQESDHCIHHHRHPQRPEEAKDQHREIEKKMDYGFKFRGNLTSHIVKSCLEASPSDIMAFSLLLWFGRQPGYFHESQAYEIVIPIIKRLLERFGTVNQLIRELERNGCAVKAQTFLVLLRVSWQGNMFELALETFQEMSKFGFVPNTFARNAMIDILFKIGRPEAALSIFTDCESPNYLTFDIAIKNLCRLGDYNSVQGLLKVMLESRYSLNIDTYMMVVNCLCKAKRVVDSLPVIGLMLVSGHEPSVTVFSILVDGFCRVGSVDVGLQMFRNMEKCGFFPNVFTYTSLIKGLFEAQMFDGALTVWRDMESKGRVPDLVLYNVLIHCFCKLGRYHDALRFFSELSHSILQPDSYTLCSLAPIINYAKDPRFLFELLEGAEMSLDLVCCNSLMNAFTQKGYASIALKIYDCMVEKGIMPDSFSYTALLSGLCSLGRLSFAVNTYQGLLVSDIRVDAYVHTAMLSGLVKAGKAHAAIRLFRKAVIENYCVDEVSFAVVLHGLIKTGGIDESRNFFNQMVEIGIVSNTCTYNVMLHGLCRTRDVAAVKNFVKEMCAVGVRLDSISFNILICFLCKSHRIHSAIHLFREMCKHRVEPTKATYAILIDGLHKVGQLEDAYLLLIEYLEGSKCIEKMGYNAAGILPLKSDTLESILRFKEITNFEHPLDSVEAC